MSARFMVLGKHFFPFFLLGIGIVVNIAILYEIFFLFPVETLFPIKWQIQYFWSVLLGSILVSMIVWFLVVTHFLSQRILIGEDGIIFIQNYKEYHVVFSDIIEIQAKKTGFFANIFDYGTMNIVTKKWEFSFSYCPHPVETAKSLLATIQK